MSPAQKYKLRRGRLEDLKEIQQLFVDTIRTVCVFDYDDQQISAWTLSIENKQRWFNIINNQYLLIAQEEERIIGFGSLDNGNYIDLLYVHKDYQGQGVAKTIYFELEKEAIRLDHSILSTDASKNG